MKLNSSIALAGCLLLSAVTYAQMTKKEAMELFQSRYDGLTKAIKKKDIAMAGTFLAPDYSAGDYTHPMNKEQTLSSFRHADTSDRAFVRKVLNVVVNGNKATTMVETTTQKLVVTQKRLTDVKLEHLYVIKTQSMDTWVLNAQWQLKHSQITRKSVTKDGKPVGGRQLGG